MLGDEELQAWRAKHPGSAAHKDELETLLGAKKLLLAQKLMDGGSVEGLQLVDGKLSATVKGCALLCCSLFTFLHIVTLLRLWQVPVHTRCTSHFQRAAGILRSAGVFACALVCFMRCVRVCDGLMVWTLSSVLSCPDGERTSGKCKHVGSVLLACFFPKDSALEADSTQRDTQRDVSAPVAVKAPSPPPVAREDSDVVIIVGVEACPKEDKGKAAAVRTAVEPAPPVPSKSPVKRTAGKLPITDMPDV